jgi:hypothetical protein
MIYPNILMGLASIIESVVLTFNCFLPPRKERKQLEFNQRLHELGDRYNISTLPVLIGKELTDLYPITDQVHKWNTFIVGKNKNYILVNCYDLNLGVDEREILNKQSDNYLVDELNEYFNPVWDKTLNGNDLQFFMIWKGKTYLIIMLQGPLQTQ